MLLNIKIMYSKIPEQSFTVSSTDKTNYIRLENLSILITNCTCLKHYTYNEKQLC